MAGSPGSLVRRVPVGRRHRQLAAWAVALALHALVFAGIAAWQIDSEWVPREPTSLDVVLVTQPSVEPGAAQAIAEANQQAVRRERVDTSSGTPVAPDKPAAPSEPPTPETLSRPQAPPEPQVPPESATPPRPEPTEAPVSPPAPSQPSAPASPPKSRTAPSGQALLAQATSSIRERGFESSPTTETTGDRDQKAARRAAEARYIADWTRRVETYGNRFYPAPSELEGQLRIRVVIGSDGQVRQAEVIQSSGYPELDQAALQTIQGAAPYRPFDRGMGERDTLTITRVWRFGKGNNFGVR
ncbi:energy transducer TonB [Modicisalibacter luteus]|uniref:TonB family protein n=1 Tax=Modicisalibacter luteus TaxID=453962 RepID=A0ABV7LYT7_9GAMM|nr:TonB family protein [Halomonas lutea]GHB03048.1 hypothetical protein GCM10007159_26040 [Halomonas lutea]